MITSDQRLPTDARRVRDQLFAADQPDAECIRKIDGPTLKSIGHIARTERILDSDAEYVDALDTLAKLRDDNNVLFLTIARGLQRVDEHRDIATASLIEVCIDEAERRGEPQGRRHGTLTRG